MESGCARKILRATCLWEVISKSVTTISIAVYDDTEIWVDDVVLYGIKPSDFAAK